MNEIEVIRSITFYGFAIPIIIFALSTLFAKRIVYSIIFAIILFISSGGIMFALCADYNAVVQILTYGIVVPILLIFTLMFTSKTENKKNNLSFTPRFFIAFSSVTVLFMLIWYVIKFSRHLSNNSEWMFNKMLISLNGVETMFALSKGIFVDYGFVFLIFGLLILVVVTGITTLNIIKEKKHD